MVTARISARARFSIRVSVARTAPSSSDLL